jgi:hypothetical protein
LGPEGLELTYFILFCYLHHKGLHFAFDTLLHTFVSSTYLYHKILCFTVITICVHLYPPRYPCQKVRHFTFVTLLYSSVPHAPPSRRCCLLLVSPLTITTHSTLMQMLHTVGVSTNHYTLQHHFIVISIWHGFLVSCT